MAVSIGDFEDPTAVYRTGQTPITSTQARVGKNSYLDQLSKLTGGQRDAAQALISLFKQYDLQSLASKIIDFVRKGFSSDTISIMLQETSEYKQRFAANDARRAAGLSVLSPREYIETERAYRQVMATSGMPKGFYDQHSDFQKFLENDLSPNELNERVKLWQDEAMTQDQTTVAELKRLYGMSTSDLAAYMMDPKRALPLVQKQARAVQFAAAAAHHGYSITKGLAEQYGGGAYNVTAEEADKGFGAIQEVQSETDKLAKIYGEGGFTVAEAAGEVFGGNAETAKKRKGLASKERATFSDTSKGATGKATGGTSY